MLLIIGIPPGLNRRIVSPRSEKLLKSGNRGFLPAVLLRCLSNRCRSCFFNLSAPAHSSGTYKPLLLPRKPEPPDLISLEQRQPPQPLDPLDPPLVASTATLVTAASSVTFVTAASLLCASGIIGPAVSLCSNATLHSDERHLRSALSPSSLSAANKLLRSGGADVSSGFFSVWAWTMNQDEVHDWLLRFSLITTRWSCHGNVEVRRFGLVRNFAPSPYLIILSLLRRMKLSLSCRRLPALNDTKMALQICTDPKKLIYIQYYSLQRNTGKCHSGGSTAMVGGAHAPYYVRKFLTG
ncbi:LOW QUALITY PROTEIN: hypothetical protein YC2023_042303 [Brassica napus]